MIEKRFEQINPVHEIAPVFFKYEGRIEAMFTVYFLALLGQALIERELRHAMKQAKIEAFPSISKTGRASAKPPSRSYASTALITQNRLLHDGRTAQVFEAELTDLQSKILTLLDVPR